jgi:5-methylcytosine-specific restriction endonuclease McrA
LVSDILFNERIIMTRKPWLSATGDYYFKQRARALVRDNFRCQFASFGLTEIEGLCTASCPEERIRLLQVHHIVERTNFLPHEIEGHDLDNLITLCIAHHEQVHPHMRKQRKAALKTIATGKKKLGDYQLK